MTTKPHPYESSEPENGREPTPEVGAAPKKARKPRGAAAAEKAAKAATAVEEPDDLNGVIRAAAGEAEAPEEPLAGKPEIQAEGDFPTVDDAFADMSEPPPEPPVTLYVLKHSTTPPKASFRVQPRARVLDASGKLVEKKVCLWMVRTPYDESLTGEAFVHPIVATLREQLERECPALTPVRFEIRLILQASGKYLLLEVPADHAGTRQAEENRQAFLTVIEKAEKESIVAVKKRGENWGSQPGAIYLPEKWPVQTLEELVRTTYKEDLIVSMDNEFVQRFRMKT
jgi:hypothetical protein